MKETLTYDVVVVGAGPAGLACAIALARGGASVAVLEKGGVVGAHILSGAVFDPRALAELFPDWRARDVPLGVAVRKDRFAFLTSQYAIPLPITPPMNNTGNYILSLGALTQWLAEQAEALGVDILCGYAAQQALYTGDTVIGVTTTGEADIRAHYTVLAEGARGSLTKTVIARFGLDKDSSPQTYGLGIKELWDIDPALHRAGEVFHSIGWPLDTTTYGGSFLYHMARNKVAVGLIVGLDYVNPYLDPFMEMQRFKTHPTIAPMFKGGQRIGYGARALAEGGIQSLPTLTFAGGMLIGDAAGFLNVARIKGIHGAIKSGLLAAESILHNTDYLTAFRSSWLHKELYAVRNIRPTFQAGLWAGVLHAGITVFTGGLAPWTLKNRADHTTLQKSSRVISYPAPDGVLTFDRASSVYLSGTAHAEDQPSHLLVEGDLTARATAAEPAPRYCPAGVYEVTNGVFGIHAVHCVHCKACDIKDSAQAITWIPPQGSGNGPNYQNM